MLSWTQPALDPLQWASVHMSGVWTVLVAKGGEEAWVAELPAQALSLELLGTVGVRQQLAESPVPPPGLLWRGTVVLRFSPSGCAGVTAL